MANLTDINLNRLTVFVAVVETGSITAAAQRLGLAKTMVSTHLQRLEVEIGSNLLVRTTRRMHLTEAGSLFYEACRKILNDTELAIAQARSNTRELRGMLRIAATVDFGATIVAPLAAELSLANLQLRIEIVASDNRLDMVAAGVDLSIRVGRLADSSHKAALLAPFEEWVLATPQFIANQIPETPQQLEQLPFVGLSVLPNPLNWTFTRQGHSSVPVRFTASIMANTSAAVNAAVKAGAGVMIQPHFSALEDVRTGQLVRLLPSWSLQCGGIYAVFPAEIRSQKVTAFIEALKRHYCETYLANSQT